MDRKDVIESMEKLFRKARRYQHVIRITDEETELMARLEKFVADQPEVIDQLLSDRYAP
jgi:hypothetical protein